MAKKLSKRNPITRWEMRAKDPTLFQENNKVVICGKIEEDFEYNHRIPGTRENVYRTRVEIVRKDGITKDYIPILVSETMIENPYVKNKWIETTGAIRTHRGNAKDGHRYKGVNVFVSECYIRNDEKELINPVNTNIVFIEGFLANDAYSPIQSKVELNVASKRNNSIRSDYIPCVAVGEKKQSLEELKVGEHVKIFGRFQSKKYLKHSLSAVPESKTAYEIFVYTVHQVR